MFDQEIFSVLRCPLSQSRLTLADAQLVEQINQRIKTGRIVNLAGHQLDRPLEAGLVRAAGDILFPVYDAIPVMLPDEAVALSQLQHK